MRAAELEWVQRWSGLWWPWWPCHSAPVTGSGRDLLQQKSILSPDAGSCQMVTLRAEHVSGPVGAKSCWKPLGFPASSDSFGKEMSLVWVAGEGSQVDGCLLGKPDL